MDKLEMTPEQQLAFDGFIDVMVQIYKMISDKIDYSKVEKAKDNEKQITRKNVYQFPLDFDILYERMTDLEKKQFMRTFIESIELYPEKKDNGRIISKIELRFPVYYDGQEGNEIRMPDKNTVETVVLMSRVKD